MRSIFDLEAGPLAVAGSRLGAPCRLDAIDGVHAALGAAVDVVEKEPVDAVGGREAGSGIGSGRGFVELGDSCYGVGQLWQLVEGEDGGAEVEVVMA